MNYTFVITHLYFQTSIQISTLLIWIVIQTLKKVIRVTALMKLRGKTQYFALVRGISLLVVNFLTVMIKKKKDLHNDSRAVRLEKGIYI